MLDDVELAIPKQARILVTGANGFVASHIIDQLLSAGYNVRGSVRDVNKNAWVGALFEERYGARNFELVSVPDMSKDGCFDEAVKGCAGVVHVASIMSGRSPEEVIPTVVAGGLNALKSAAKEPAVKRVVYTSSSIAATFPKPDEKFVIDENSWNEESIKTAWAAPGKELGMYRMNVYGASKAQTEKDLWKWYDETKPAFEFSTVLPNVNFGPVLSPEHQGFPSTVEWARYVFLEKDISGQASALPQHFISVLDTANLHLAALLNPSVQHERILGTAAPYTWDEVIAIFRKHFPEKEWKKSFAHLGRDISVVRNERAKELLGWMGRKEGFRGLEESVDEMVKDWVV
ncbi:dihydroflavonol-4-reductase [Patellaria atrata CBS 101060]|uniref:Dihydroflavonol-4-reductase n=1 Tax=Patellaria atrata CBS 101060 TaxID=1346257 RepID=A0A9P4VVY7_9PEZI|nr:dihydroflavonol-4-reductase [Patellaria atrata CBS 101060]